MTEAIHIENVQAIRDLAIPVPEEGGCVVLVGENGEGKSTALEAIRCLLGENVDLAARDGAKQGSVSGFGRYASIAGRITRHGELRVSHLAGADPGPLIHPGREGADAANRVRLRALVQLAGVELTGHDFEHLVEGIDKLEKLVPPQALGHSHPIDLQGAIKRGLEATARQHADRAEALARRAEGTSTTVRELVGDADLSGVPTVAEARAAHEAAIRAHAGAQSSLESFALREATVAAARAGLAELGGAPAVDAALEALERGRDALAEERSAFETLCSRDAQAARAQVHELEVELSALRERLGAAQSAERWLSDEQGRARARMAAEHQRSIDRLREASDAAKSFASKRQELERAIADAERVPVIAPETVERLRAEADAAAALLSRADLAARVAPKRAEAQRIAEEAAAENERASRIREAARATESVLTAAVTRVCPDGIAIQDGIILVRHEKRGLMTWADLSPGEATRLALQIAIRAVVERTGEAGLRPVLVMDQPYYESLDPRRRRELEEIARDMGVLIYTALPAEGELRAEVA